jgi:hypothetical protein
MPTEPAQAEGLLAKENVLTVSRALEFALFMDTKLDVAKQAAFRLPPN